MVHDDNGTLALQSSVLVGLNEYKAEAMSKFAVLYRDKKMILANNQNRVSVTWEDLARAHFGKTLGRAMMMGWGEVDPQLDLSKSYILEKGFVSWYTDFRDIGIETKLFDPVTVNAGAENFTKADIFTYSGNGDNKVSYPELLQFVNMIISGGGTTTEQIYQDMVAAGCSLSEVDDFNKPLLDEKCFVKQFRRHSKLYFNNLYNYSDYLEHLSEVEFVDYYNGLISLSSEKANLGARIGTAEIRVITMTSMFIEALFGAYDQGQTFNQLDQSEVIQAYPRFKALIDQKALGKLDDWKSAFNICRLRYSTEDFLQKVFLFLAYNGGLPTQKDIRFRSCILGDFGGDIFQLRGAVDRKKIINTFKFLKSDASLEDAQSQN
jgi:hypothetical protein